MAKNYLNESLPEGERLGQVGITKQGYKMKIIEYNLYSDICVELISPDVSYVHTTYGNFLRGSIRNVYHVTNGYHGYFGLGPYTSIETDKDGKHVMSKAYQMWSGMHKRAEDYEKRRPAYKDVTIEECWWDYQNFHKWFDENYYEVPGEVMSIDKDILIPGNKIYGPNKCLIIPLRINDMFIAPNQNNKKGNSLPVGISIRENSINITYRVTVQYVNEKLENRLIQKVFKNLEDAKYYYRTIKLDSINNVVNYYKNKLPYHVINALINYKDPTWY